MTISLPLHDGDSFVQINDNVAARLDGFDLRLLAGRVVAIRDNQFFDLQNLIAGGGAITRNGDPYDLRHQNLAVLYYDFGLSPIAFHNRTALSTLALVRQGEVIIHQRYEGWVALQSSAPRPRRDLAIFLRALQSAETHACRWRYEGVQHIMPRLGHDGTPSSSLSAETILYQLKRFLMMAPAAWSPGA